MRGGNGNLRGCASEQFPAAPPVGGSLRRGGERRCVPLRLRNFAALAQVRAALARTEFQTVRTTAYTHTEADHLEYSNHNALGGILHAAGPPVAVASAPVMGFVETPAPARSAALRAPARALPVPADDAAGGFHPSANPGSTMPTFAVDDAAESPVRATNGAPYYSPGAVSARGGPSADGAAYPGGGLVSTRRR